MPETFDQMDLMDTASIVDARRNQQSARGARNARAGIREITFEHGKPVTLGEGLDRLDAVARKSKTDSIVGKTIHHFKDALLDLVPTKLPHMPLPDMQSVQPSATGVLSYVHAFINAKRFSDDPNPRTKRIGLKMYNDYYARLEADLEEMFVLRSRRQMLLASTADRNRLGEAARSMCSNVQNLLASSDATKSELRDASDALHLTSLELGVAHQADECLFENELQSLIECASIFAKYGEKLVHDTLDGSTDFSVNKQLVDEAMQVQRVSAFRKSVREFDKHPSLQNWQAQSRAAHKFLIDATINHHYEAVGRAAVMLDPSTRCFAHGVHAVQAFQSQAQANTARAEAALQALQALDVGESSANSKSKQIKRKIQAPKVRKLGSMDALRNGPFAEPASRFSDNEVSENEVSANALRTRIQQAATSIFEPVALEGAVAKLVLDNLSAFAEVVGFNQKIARTNQTILGELDLHLDTAIVECTLRTSGKAMQLKKYLNDREINPQKKAVVLYAERYTEQVPAGVLHARNPFELGDILFALKADEVGWMRKRS